MHNPVRLYMSMSLDGYIAGPGDRPGQELGRDGGRLFSWLGDRESDGPSGQVYREAAATGAVISGRRTFELAGRWQGDHHDGVPILVLTRQVDDGDVPPGHARFVTALGYAELGRAEAGDGSRLVIVKFPAEPAATLELVHRPAGGRVDMGSGIDHLAIQADTLAVTLKTLAEAGLEPEPAQYPGGPRGPKTSWLTDPDGYRTELVEWPSGHPGGITAADFS